MSKDYEIRIRLTPHFPSKPYFWYVVMFEDGSNKWKLCGYGWAETPAQAFEDGINFYNQL